MSEQKMITIEKETTSYGIFFRRPVQKINIETCPYPDDEICAATWLKRNRFNPITRLLNFGRFNQYIKFMEEVEDAAGIKVRVLTFPIYFKRNIREAFHKFPEDHMINNVYSWGYEPYKNKCSGAAEVEYTKIKFNDGTEKKIVERKSFHYTYKHVIEKEFL
jgi:hypothetical protein